MCQRRWSRSLSAGRDDSPRSDDPPVASTVQHACVDSRSGENQTVRSQTMQAASPSSAYLLFEGSSAIGLPLMGFGTHEEATAVTAIIDDIRLL